MATTTNDDKWEFDHEDPRISVVADALIDNHAVWLDQTDDEVAIDPDEAARIALLALDNYDRLNPEHCQWPCHADEQSSIVRYLNTYWKVNGLPVALLDDIVGVIEYKAGDLSASLVIEPETGQ